MAEEAVAKKNTAVESLVKEFGTLLYSSLKDLVDTMSWYESSPDHLEKSHDWRKEKENGGEELITDRKVPM